MNPTRIALCVLLLFHTISFGVLGCGQERDEIVTPEREEAWTEAQTAGLELGAVEVDASTRELVLHFRDDGRARQLRLVAGSGFSAKLCDAAGRVEYGFAVQADAGALRLSQRNAQHELLQTAAILRDGVRDTRSQLDGSDFDAGALEPSQKLLDALERSGLDRAQSERDLLFGLLQNERVLELLTTRTQEIAAKRGSGLDLEAYKRDPDAGEVSCALASLASLSCFCLALPVCWVPCIPSLGTSIACAIAVVVSWVQSWFD